MKIRRGGGRPPGLVRSCGSCRMIRAVNRQTTINPPNPQILKLKIFDAQVAQSPIVATKLLRAFRRKQSTKTCAVS